MMMTIHLYYVLTETSRTPNFTKYTSL